MNGGPNEFWASTCPDAPAYFSGMRIITMFVLATALFLIPLGCDDSPAEREQKVDNAADKTGDAMKRGAEKVGNALDKAADSTGKVINDVAEKAPRVKVDVDVTTQPSATQSSRTVTETKTTTTTRPASP
jgi:hypothetical protein